MVPPRSCQRLGPRASGRRREGVAFEQVETGHADIDSMYHAKYDRYGASIVGSVVSPDSHAATFRLLPQS
jgi:hypothetical protein